MSARRASSSALASDVFARRSALDWASKRILARFWPFLTLSPSSDLRATIRPVDSAWIVTCCSASMVLAAVITAVIEPLSTTPGTTGTASISSSLSLSSSDLPNPFLPAFAWQPAFIVIPTVTAVRRPESARRRTRREVQDPAGQPSWPEARREAEDIARVIQIWP